MEKEYRSFDDVFPDVQNTMNDALGVDKDEITPDMRYPGDLGAESIDDLDVVFRLENKNRIDIPRSEFLDAIGYPDGSAGSLASLIRRFSSENKSMDQEDLEHDIRVRCGQYFDHQGKVDLDRTSEFLAEVQKMFGIPSREFKPIRAHWLQGSLKTDKELPNPEDYWLLPEGELRRLTEYLRVKTAKTVTDCK